MNDLKARVSGTNGQYSIYERGGYLATVNDQETAERIVAALAAHQQLAAERARRAALEAEVARLREALLPFANYANWDGVDEFEPPEGRMGVMTYVDAARAVLGLPVADSPQNGED